MSELDAVKIADLVVRKINDGLLRMPDEWRDNVSKGWVLPRVTVPYKSPNNGEYFQIELYVTSEGGLILRITDFYGQHIYERTFA